MFLRCFSTLAAALLLPVSGWAEWPPVEAGPIAGRAQAAARTLAERQGSVGVLVMAHGGDADWNLQVEEAVAPLAAGGPTEIAFGMADADSLQAAVGRLEGRGVRRIAVVRLFISGDSFLERTEKILGLRPGAPARPADPHAGHGGHSHGPQGGGHPAPGANPHDPDSMPLWRVETQSEFSIAREGLMDSPRMAEVLAARVLALSRDPARESVLILGHGPADDAENGRWLARMEALSQPARAAAAFRELRVETLREDWPSRRGEATRRIREFVQAAGQNGGRAIVVPFRVSGFGPYREVLDGLAYDADGVGLLPHPEVSRWLEETAADAAAAMGWIR